MRKVKLLNAYYSLYQDGDVVELYSLEDILTSDLIDDEEKQICKKNYKYEEVDIAGFVKEETYKDEYGKRKFIHIYYDEIEELEKIEEKTNYIQNEFVDKVEIDKVRLNDIVITRDDDDWQGLYVNGILEYQNHKIDIYVLSKYTPIISIKIIDVELSEDVDGFPNNLTDLEYEK